VTYQKLKVAKHKVVGAKQVLKAIERDQAETVYVADDAEQRVVKPVIEQALLKHLPVEQVASMQELGRICGIKVGAAVAAVLRE